jgi:hypothetical protein
VGEVEQEAEAERAFLEGIVRGTTAKVDWRRRCKGRLAGGGKGRRQQLGGGKEIHSSAACRTAAAVVPAT